MTVHKKVTLPRARVGELVRYHRTAPTALMRVTYIDGDVYYGQQCLGLAIGVHHRYVRLPLEQDQREWDHHEQWRLLNEVPRGRAIVQALPAFHRELLK